MARNIVEAGTEVSKFPYAKTFVISAFEKIVSSARSTNEGADTESDNFNDGFYLLRNAVQVVEAWKNFWSDFHHNGRPVRWLKITNDLALQGKTESLLVRKDYSDLFRVAHDSPHEEIWELHQRDHSRLKSTERDDRIYERIREAYLPEVKAESDAWQMTPFSLQVRSGRQIETLRRGEKRLDNAFYAFVFPGLEVLGFKTPVLYL